MHRRTLRIGVLVVAACAAVMLAQLPAGAIVVSGTPSPVTGNATWFSGLGGPYGGCGLPQANVRPEPQDCYAPADSRAATSPGARQVPSRLKYPSLCTANSQRPPSRGHSQNC